MNFYIKFPDGLYTELFDTPNFTIEEELEDLLGLMDGMERWARIVGPFPEGVDQYNATEGDTYGPSVQVAGSVERLILQVSGIDDARPERLFNVSKTVPDASHEPTEVVVRGPGWTKVYPEEVLSLADVIPIIAHYFVMRPPFPPTYTCAGSTTDPE